MLVRVLVVVEEEALEQRLRLLLTQPDVLATTVARPQQDLGELMRENSDLIIVSRSLLAEPVAASIRALRRLPDRPEVVVMREVENGQERAHLLAAGACAVAFTGVSDEALGALMTQIVERRADDMKARLESQHSTKQVRLSDFVSSSAAMHSFLETVYQVVDADNSLLILGETGVGKEHLARAIHAESRRAEGPFVAINCGALPEQLLESELFGHEEGAFTGANRAVRGQFELAHRGTIFLDEIGEMPMHLQVKLLQVLERRQIRRVGGERVIDIDVRVMAATNRHVTAEIAAGRFRNDLYYRLGAIALTIPALRDRHEDIPELVESYLRHFNINTGRSIRGVAPAALHAMQRYAWPGNVRELINVVERAVLLCASEQISLSELPANIAQADGGTAIQLAPVPGASETMGTLPVWDSLPLDVARTAALEAFEHAYFSRLLLRTHGRVNETAGLAGISSRALYDKMRRLGLRKEDYRPRRVPPPREAVS